jgi:D-xylose 1-dehydrogenase (NADP+, D-xylono-1,5-lactone-forming)
MQHIRWGLLSTARINRRVIPAIRASKHGKLAAVASRDGAKAREYAAQWEIPQVYDSYEAMLASDAVDVVYISLPNHLHAEWTVRALQAGKHVLCEKPFALSVEEVDRMIQASRETGRVLAEAFMYRHHPQMKLIGSYVREGRLGDISLVRGLFSFFMQNPAGNVRMVPEYGGGAMWDIGIYPLSFAQFIFGQAPISVTAVQQTGPTGVDEDFAGQLHYSGGGIAQIACSFRIPFHTSVEVHGSQGSIELNRPFTQPNERGREIRFTPLDGDAKNLSAKKLDPYLGEVEDMHAAIMDGTPPLISLQESRDHVRTANALYQAAKTGQPVQLDAYVPDHIQPSISPK